MTNTEYLKHKLYKANIYLAFNRNHLRRPGENISNMMSLFLLIQIDKYGLSIENCCFVNEKLKYGCQMDIIKAIISKTKTIRMYDILLYEACIQNLKIIRKPHLTYPPINIS